MSEGALERVVVEGWVVGRRRRGQVEEEDVGGVGGVAGVGGQACRKGAEILGGGCVWEVLMVGRTTTSACPATTPPAGAA
eukprot:365515-Chlamydomonas_euryale.AAC.4